jgi:hypothetical protein
MKKFLSLAALTFAMAGTVALSSARAEDAPKTEEKITEVRVCPMANKAVKGDGAGNTTFKTYKVFFCCGGCKGGFDKLSDEDKQKKVDAALKTQNAKPAEAPKA